MNVNAETEHIGFIVASCVFSHFNVSMDSLYNFRGNCCEKVARMYVYLILHTEFNISTRQISAFMKKSQRNILRCVSKLKYQVGFFEEERSVYDNLMKEIRGKLSA